MVKKGSSIQVRQRVFLRIACSGEVFGAERSEQGLQIGLRKLFVLEASAEIRRQAGGVRHRRLRAGLVLVVARRAATHEPSEVVPVQMGLDREPSVHRSGWTSRRGFKVSPARLNEMLCACGEFGSGVMALVAGSIAPPLADKPSHRRAAPRVDESAQVAESRAMSRPRAGPRCMCSASRCSRRLRQDWASFTPAGFDADHSWGRAPIGPGLMRSAR